MDQRLASPVMVFALAASAGFLVALDATIAIAAFPALREAFAGVGPSTLSWVLNAYTIIYAALLAPSGSLVDRWGSKRVFLIGAGIFTVASGFCGLAPDAWTLIIGRGFQAVGGAMLTPAALTLILRAFPAEKRASMVGIYSAIGALAAAMGPSVGAAIIEVAGWRSAFLINVPVGMVVIGLCLRLSLGREETRTDQRFDLTGIMILVTAMVLMTGAVVREGALTDPSLATIISFVAGLLALALYCVHAMRRPHAAIDLGLFRIKQYGTASLITFIFGVAFAILFLNTFLFLIEVWSYSASLAGLAVMPGPLAVIPTAILVARVSVPISLPLRIVIGALILAAGQILMAMMATEEPAYWTLLFPIQVVGGVAVGLVLPGITALAVAHLPPEKYGSGGAVNNAVRQFGGAIGTAIAITLIGQSGALLSDFQTAWVVMASLAILIAGIAAALVVREGGPRPALATGPSDKR